MPKMPLRSPIPYPARPRRTAARPPTPRLLSRLLLLALMGAGSAGAGPASNDPPPLAPVPDPAPTDPSPMPLVVSIVAAVRGGS